MAAMNWTFIGHSMYIFTTVYRILDLIEI